MHNAVKRILMITEPRDYHGLMMKLALEAKGAKVDTASISLFPQKFDLSVTLPDTSGSGVNLFWGHNKHPYDTIINRRVAFPVIGDDLAAADRHYSETLCHQMTVGMLTMQSRSAFAINDYQAAMTAQFKPRQLAAARKVGLQIPKTIVSNGAGQVREFFDKTDSIIFKNLRPALWVVDDKSHVSAQMITEITSELLDKHAEGLKYGPGIFQQKVEKDFELRVVVMGRSLFCMRLNSQDYDDSKLDWRMSLDNYKKLYGGQHELSPELTGQLYDFMDEIELVFGCIDLIIDAKGTPIFLEVNEMGQFLWMEELAAEFSLLDAFADFALSGSSQFQYEKSSDAVSYTDLNAYDGEQELLELFQAHFPEPISTSSPIIYSEVK